MKTGTQSTSSKKAITSLALGLASFICMFFTGIAAIILGIIAMSEISKSNGRLKGQGIATTGIVLGALGCLWTLPVLLLAMLMPAVQQVRSAARTAESMGNMRDIAIGMFNFEQAYRSFPPAKGANNQLSWRVHILPYIEHMDLYEEFHLDEPWNSPHNLTLVDRMPDLYISPSVELAPGKTVYVVPTSPPTQDPLARQHSAAFIQGQPGPRIADFLDGTSNTILMLEVEPEAAVTWTQPADWIYDPDDPMHSLGRKSSFAAAMADSTVQRLQNSLSPERFKSMITRAAGDSGF